MKKLLFRLAILVGIAYAIRTLLEDEGRRKGLAHLPVTAMERCMEMMPEDSPPKVMMSSLRRLQEQSDQLLALLREQNELLRERLRAQESSSGE